MRKLAFLLSLSLILFVSCAPKVIPLKGNYSKTPYTFMSDKSREEVWDNIIDYFAQNGISIRIIDKSSGLIISGEYTALTTTYELKDGSLKNPKAYVVSQKYYDKAANKYIYPTASVGEWNIRIKEVGGKTSINVNLLNIRAKLGTYNSPVTGKTFTNDGYASLNDKAFSLHNFEKGIAEIVNN